MKNNFCDFWQVQAELWLIYVVYVYHSSKIEFSCD